MDSQNNNPWNEWANYILLMIKQHSADIAGTKKDVDDSCLKLEGKLTKEEFQKFLINDYVIFKTEVLTKAKIAGIVWGAAIGGIVSFVIALISFLLKI